MDRMCFQDVLLSLYSVDIYKPVENIIALMEHTKNANKDNYMSITTTIKNSNGGSTGEVDILMTGIRFE